MYDGKTGMSPRKTMAYGDKNESPDIGGSFGADSLENYAVTHPEIDSDLHSRTLKDEDRHNGMPVYHTRGKHPSQRNPDHGPHAGAHGPEFGRRDMKKMKTSY